MSRGHGFAQQLPVHIHPYLVQPVGQTYIIIPQEFIVDLCLKAVRKGASVQLLKDHTVGAAVQVNDQLIPEPGVIVIHFDQSAPFHQPELLCHIEPAVPGDLRIHVQHLRSGFPGFKNELS